MSNEHIGFDEVHILHQLKHYLPTQAPLKDFIHHNTLHAFQNQRFDLAIRNASKIFGYKVSFSVDEFRDLYLQKKVAPEILEQIIERKKGKGEKQNWVDKVLHTTYDEVHPRKTGQLRKRWKEIYHLDLDTIVHTNLFRILNSYLDQGVAIHKFPVSHYSFLDSLRELEKNSFVSFFKTKRARGLFFDESLTIRDLLTILVGDEKYFSQYLFDQQFAHPGWSGLISAIEDKPLSLLDGRKISLSGLIRLELLLEIDNLDNSLKRKWKPIATDLDIPPVELFSKNELTELDEVLNIWQEAYEWTYFDQVLAGIQEQQATTALQATPSFMAFFCIDDRVGSIRRHIEHLDPKCETYGTPGHFGVDAFYQPKNARFYTKICPAPLSPRHLIKEVTTNRENRSEVHFTKTTHSLFRGWLITQTLGFWSAIKLMFNVFKPSFGPASSSSFSHMDEFSTITVENRSPGHSLDGLQLGYTVDEMTDRVEAVLKSTGAISGFSSLVYVIGHGSSSANNTHYAGYDCGACSGRPGSANARAFSYMANHKEVRIKLAQRGIHIPLETEFIGGLHDTSRDEFGFYDEELLSPTNLKLHYGHLKVFKNALQLNAKERSRRFMSIDTNLEAWEIHDQVKKRSVSLFEPRPELNHATNSLCLIGRNYIKKQLFLDRRAFLNSYDYRIDPEGIYLLSILNAAAPVCGGINLEYYFSRVDNENLGAGSKLPHNVMGLIGVANGFEGDLRTGLPYQMVEVHDPIRLMIIVEHSPEIVLKVIQKNAATYEWFENEWVILSVIHPETKELFTFRSGNFHPYHPLARHIDTLTSHQLVTLFEETDENLPVYHIS